MHCSWSKSTPTPVCTVSRRLIRSGYRDVSQSEQTHFYRSGNNRFPKSALRKTVRERFKCEQDLHLLVELHEYGVHLTCFHQSTASRAMEHAYGSISRNVTTTTIPTMQDGIASTYPRWSSRWRDRNKDSIKFLLTTAWSAWIASERRVEEPLG